MGSLARELLLDDEKLNYDEYVDMGNVQLDSDDE
jgi:hypothetical protein